MNDAQSRRPVTSKARGICKYYTSPRGCFAGNSCKFLHISESEASRSQDPVLTPYDKAKQCRYYANGYCKRADKCWFLHTDETPKTVQGAEDDSTDEIYCSICFEKPATFGLLDGCSHIFCLQCIRQWREPSDKLGDVMESGNTKKCPMCRARSRYIIPSSHFCKEGEEAKARAIQNYKESMSRVPCKYFKESIKKNAAKPLCPFGKDCFYQHLNNDGSTYIFKEGKDTSIRLYRNSLRSNRSTPLLFGLGRQTDFPNFPLALDVTAGSDGEVDAVNLAETIAMDMYNRMVVEVVEGPPERRRGRDGRAQASRPGNNGVVDQATLDRARHRMMAGAVTAIQAELSRLEPWNTESARPVVVPGTLPPSEWNLDSDGDWDGEVDDGLPWGWNNPTEPGIPPDTGVIERLGILADHMLGSLQVLGGRDTNTPPPPLEPVSEPVLGEEPSATDDDMPALQSVSDSSESEVGHEDDSEPSHHEEEAEGQGVASAVRAFDLVFNGPPRNGDGPGAWPLFRMWNQPPPLLAPSVPEASSRFSTVVGRDEIQRLFIAFDDEDQGDQGDDEGEESDDAQTPDLNADEESIDSGGLAADPPPFVTDGRGRVVWSNKPPETAETLATTGSAEPPVDNNPAGPRTFLGRVFGALF